VVGAQPDLSRKAEERCEAYRPEEGQEIQYHDEKVGPARTTEIVLHKRWPFISFFGTQEGEFSLTLRSIKAVSHAPPPSYAQIVSDPSEPEDAEKPLPRSLWRYLPAVLLAAHLAALATFILMKRCWTRGILAVRPWFWS
jgi:hypothetical protein